MVGDGHQIHAAPLGSAVNVDGLRVAVPAAEELQVLRHAGMARVHVQVGLVKLAPLFGLHKMLY